MQKFFNLVFKTIPYKNHYYFNSFTDKLQKRNLKKQEQEFTSEINQLANKPSYTMIDYKQRINDTLIKMSQGLRAMISGVDNETKSHLLQQQRILNAMFDEELASSEVKINQDAKKEISVVAQCEVQDINRLLDSFLYFKNLHEFLRKLKENGEELPQNQEELKNRYMNDPQAIKYARERTNRKPRQSMKQLRRRIKWGIPQHLYEQTQ